MVHISPGLVKLIAASIMTSLLAIAGYMLIWNRDDAAFKRVVIIQLEQMKEAIDDVKNVTSIVPTNTQRINDHERRLNRVEDHAEQSIHIPVRRKDHE